MRCPHGCRGSFAVGSLLRDHLRTVHGEPIQRQGVPDEESALAEERS